jgi:peroxiredoxin
MILKYLSFFSPSWLSLEEAQALYDNFTEEQKKSPSAKFVAQMIRNKRKSQTGEKAYDFQFFTKDSVEMHLSDFQKKNYVLLDFGASWCKPCVANIPYIRSCYDKYKDKGMVVIEISNDDSEEAWKNSIEKNGTSDWYHVLDRPTFKDLKSLNRIYNIFWYPHYLLIDRNGFIVGRWGGMTDKDKKEFEECLERLSNES